MILSIQTNIGTLNTYSGFFLNLGSQIKKIMTKSVSLNKVFEKYPTLKTRLDQYLNSVPAQQREEDFEKFRKFIEGDMTWAEVTSIPKALLKEITQIAYLKFKMAEYSMAEVLFKGLAIIDHTNWYYRAALGAIYQKQKLFEQAIEEYSMALMFEENELSALVNRGECHMALGKTDEAKNDFQKALNTKVGESNRWIKRAGALLNKINRDSVKK